MRPSARTASRSSVSSRTEASIRSRENASILARENSLISSPWTIVYAPSRVVQGNEEMRPSGTP